MARCAVCSDKVVLPSGVVKRSRRLRTWSNYAELDSLARAGCDLCILVRQHWYYYWGPDNSLGLPMEEYKISLTFLNFDPGASNRESLTLLIDRKSSSMFNLGHVSVVHDGAGRKEARFPCPSDEYDVSAQARALLHDCYSSHKECDKPPLFDNRSHTLPRRLLDLSHGPTIVLVDVSARISEGFATAAELSQYCTLSYRWGSSAHDCILSAPFSGTIKLVLDTLPQTFKDAVLIARALDVRFLWIDALCIIQPSAYADNTDWETEGSKMGVIYQSALFTIAATCADSADDGFLSKVGSKLHLAMPCEVPSYTRSKKAQPALLQAHSPSLSRYIGRSKLNRRGWVQQERTLSRRVLHFTEQGIFRECYEKSAHSYFGDISSDWTQELIRLPRIFKSQVDTFHWDTFITNYSDSWFTNPKDRLIALSSVARILQPKFPDSEYYAGLWSKNLFNGLMWYCRYPPIDPSSVHLSIAPSWSWVSVMTTIAFNSTSWNLEPALAEILNVDISLESADNVYGNVRRGELKVHGQLFHQTLPTTNQSIEGAGMLYWDDQQDTSKAGQCYTILPLRAKSEDHKKVSYCCIILELLPPPPDCKPEDLGISTYRRIGYVEIVEAKGMKKWEKKLKKEWPAFQAGMQTFIIV